VGKETSSSLPGLSCRFDQTSINDFTSFEFKAFLAYLALELIEASAVEVHGFEVRSEAGNGGIIGTGLIAERQGSGPLIMSSISGSEWS